ncbi:predicted protein [Histoplasma mississippiense (nom. inval.)]|uniref:predicted protein n=1 Tax=Ajellomyces capsulatus (strain NAm1 / WU24) TaxID=2059318 RepID=UPI000157CA4A|nr:predicted protein [Histoplasma mississippiense (nom. inval.)]EDN09508.1 predicted protein [Histoplasma mississippiense (nom. inval.)]
MVPNFQGLLYSPFYSRLPRNQLMSMNFIYMLQNLFQHKENPILEPRAGAGDTHNVKGGSGCPLFFAKYFTVLNPPRPAVSVKGNRSITLKLSPHKLSRRNLESSELDAIALRQFQVFNLNFAPIRSFALCYMPQNMPHFRVSAVSTGTTPGMVNNLICTMSETEHESYLNQSAGENAHILSYGKRSESRCKQVISAWNSGFNLLLLRRLETSSRQQEVKVGVK